MIGIIQLDVKNEAFFRIFIIILKNCYNMVCYMFVTLLKTPKCIVKCFD